MAIETGYKVTITATIKADLTSAEYLSHLQASLVAIEEAIKLTVSEPEEMAPRDVTFYDARIVPYTKRGKAGA